MIEARENIDLVTMKRQGDLEASQRDYENLAATSATQTDASTPALPPADVRTVESVPPPNPVPPEDPPSAITGPRLAIAGAFILILFLFWFIPRRR